MEPTAPTTEAVAAVIRARTRGTRGDDLGTFDETTTPTADQVQELITQAVDDVVVETGNDIPESVQSMFTSVAALGAAMSVELSYFPEQVASGRSPYDQLERMYTRKLASLTSAVVEALATGEVIAGAGSAPLPQGSFDAAPQDEIW